jgi:hypothetical protein
MPNGVTVQAPYQSHPKVAMLTHWVAGPVSHPYPSVSNCRTRNSVNGDPGSPVLGLPDCQRADIGEQAPLYQSLKSAGLALPDNYDATSFSTVEENLRIKLQAVRIGDILLASCSCEAQSDLIKNLESRTDATTGNMFLGFDYANQADIDEGWPGLGVPACHPIGDGSSYDCPDPTKDWLFGSKRTTISKAAFDHMEAEIRNDAAGWNDPSYAAQANSEPTDLSQIKGNFTHEELGAPGPFAHCRGYDVSVGLGHTGDYDGYTVSYREYMARDSYRKALTSYGPHTADYMVTNLVSMAANLMCGSPLLAQVTDPLAAADEQRQNAEAVALGQLSLFYYDGWTAQIPDNAGPAHALAQPWDVQRFDVTQFRWVGGDNWTDNPDVEVQRLVGGTWQPYADQSGEVQVFLDKPTDAVTGLVTNRSGGQQWNWRASFEAFDSYPRADVPGGQVPDGTYRFHVQGKIHTGGVAAPYEIASAPFTVSPWRGIAVHDLRRDGRTVSFTVDPITYPRLPSAPHRAGIAFYADDQGGTPGHGPICMTCAFRPWATAGQVASALVEVRDGASSQTQLIAASFDPATGRWTATVPSGLAQTVRVPVGGVRDAYGEINGQALALTG